MQVVTLPDQDLVFAFFDVVLRDHSQTEAAALIGVSQGRVSRWSNPKQPPDGVRPSTRRAILAVLKEKGVEDEGEILRRAERWRANPPIPPGKARGRAAKERYRIVPESARAPDDEDTTNEVLSAADNVRYLLSMDVVEKTLGREEAARMARSIAAGMREEGRRLLEDWADTLTEQGTHRAD